MRRITLKVLIISLLVFVDIYFIWIDETNKCNMALNLIDLLEVTDDILKRNNIEFWLNCGINIYRI